MGVRGIQILYMVSWKIVLMPMMVSWLNVAVKRVEGDDKFENDEGIAAVTHTGCSEYIIPKSDD